MTTPKLYYVGAVPAPTTGADIANNGPHTPASIDQNFRNIAEVFNQGGGVAVYTEGTWTPVLSCTHGGTISLTDCTYTRTGREYVCYATIADSVSLSFDGSANTITGLPATPASSYNAGTVTKVGTNPVIAYPALVIGSAIYPAAFSLTAGQKAVLSIRFRI